MKPIQLTMVAFGPYNKQEIIDFRKLQSNLFLITGPTGAGKTSIFDGISYSIYGKTSGTSRPEKSVRCDHAPEDLLTEVVFEFELNAKKYKVTRIPEQDRLKKSGEGFTKQKSDALLEAEHFERPIVGVKLVNEYLESLIGLNQKQFKQIMMIPQGEFRELLMADSNERSEIMKNIFKTYFYEALQKKFSEDKKVLKNGLDQHLKNIELLLSQIETDDEELNAYLDMEVKPMDLIIKKTIELTERQTNILNEQNLMLTQLKEDYKKQLEEKHLQITFNHELNTYRDAKSTLDQLLADKEVYETKKNRIEVLNAVAKIKPYYDQNMRLKEKEKLLKEQFTSKEISLKDKAEQSEKIQKEYEKVTSSAYTEKMKALDEYIYQLNQHLQKIKEAELLLAQVDSQSEILNKQQENVKKISDSLGENQEKRKELLAFIELNEHCKLDFEKLSQKKSELERQKKNLETAVACKDKLTALSDQIKLVQVEVDEKKKLYDDKTLAYKTLQKNYHLNQAAILASELADHIPCPVCGSLEHPSKAVFHGEIITEGFLKTIESQWTSAQDIYQKSLLSYEKALEKKENENTNFENAMKILYEDGVVKSLSKDDLDQGIGDFKVSLSNWEVQFRALEETVKAYDLKKEALKAINLTIEEHTLTFNHEQKQLEEILEIAKQLKIQYDTIIQSIPEKLRNKKDLNLEKEMSLKALDHQTVYREDLMNRYQILKDEYLTIQTQLDTLKVQLKEIESEIEASDGQLKNKLFEVEVNALEGFTMLITALEELDALKEEVELYNNQVLLLSNKCTELKAYENEQAKDLEKLEVQIKETEEKEQSYVNTINSLTKKNDDFIKIVDRIQKIKSEIASSEGTYRVLAEMTDILTGKNPKNMSLEKFVQATYLEDILQVANGRLLKMTNNRYQLRIAEDVLDRRSGSGLDLEVEDSYTGQPRSVKTLSGGESFKASLAMALGMAEVVQAYAGGIQLDTVFIDEGFGTLDQESLDSAINCLVELQDTGRLVGIISHVSELKERIQTQLIVSPSDQGSTTEFVQG
ncbi:MAG: AAA family ATPase [Clostridia bacterium]|nr:AAA family ATPase [Clostridia bacterium]